MGRPWGLSGPAFLWLYGVALLAAVGFAVYLRWAVRRPRLAEPVPAGDPVTVAQLRGGPERVVEVGLARLVEQGAVRVTRVGMVTRTTRTVPDPLDQAVLDALGGRTREVHEVLGRAVGLAPVTGVADSCVARRLQVSPATWRRVRRIGLAAAYAVLCVGLARLVTGVAGGYPVGYLVLELLATGVVLVVLHVSGRSATGPHTIHGERLLAAAEGSPENLVALGGLRAYPDRTVAAAMAATSTGPRSAKRGSRAVAAGTAGSVGATSASASCGSGSSSCGSSGGGSSCGGGGCGGGGT